MSSQFKPWLVLAIIFIVGVVTGSALTIGLAPHFKHPPAPPQMKRHWMEYLTQRLDLTADQQAKIQPIVADATSLSFVRTLINYINVGSYGDLRWSPNPGQVAR